MSTIPPPPPSPNESSAQTALPSPGISQNSGSAPEVAPSASPPAGAAALPTAGIAGNSAPATVAAPAGAPIPKGDYPARCANRHVLGAYSVPSNPPPDGTKCGECGAEFDKTRKRAARKPKGEVDAKAIVPVPGAKPAAPDKPSSFARMWESAKVYLAADKVTPRMVENGPAVRQWIVQPFVQSPLDGKLKDHGLDPSLIVVKVGPKRAPQTIYATDLLASSLSNLVGALIPVSLAGSGHPMFAEAMKLYAASVALERAIKELNVARIEGRPPQGHTLDMTTDIESK